MICHHPVHDFLSLDFHGEKHAGIVLAAIGALAVTAAVVFWQLR